MKVIVIGDVAVAASLRLWSLPAVGSNTVADEVNFYVTGVAANIASALHALGTEVTLVGAVGIDTFGEDVKSELLRRGIRAELVSVAEGKTGFFVIVVDSTGERTIIGYRGANDRLRIDQSFILSVRPNWCHVSGYTLLNEGAADDFAIAVPRLRRFGMKVSVDLEGLAYSRMRVDVADLTVLCTKSEFEAYFNLAFRPQTVAPAADIIVRGGKEGCWYAHDGSFRRIPAYASPEVRDSTGAGDAFNAAFIAARLSGLDLSEACSWGNAAGFLKVQQKGPHVEPTTAAIREIVKRGASQTEVVI